MKESLNPCLDDLRLEYVLMQAWKKTSSYLRTHSWYADTLGIDYQSLRIPAFIAEIREAIDGYVDWKPDPLHLVPAPKTQKWHFKDKKWIPRPSKNNRRTLRPLAHVSLRDQVVATAIMLCLADRVETQMKDPRLPIESEKNRQSVLAYGHRLLCDDTGNGNGDLRHRWGSTKLYRQYSQDYETFLRRPRVVAERLDFKSNEFEVAIVQSDLSKFYDRVQPNLLRQKVEQIRQEGDDPRFFEFLGRVFNWLWADEKRAARHARDNGLDGFMKVALPQGLVASGFFANIVMLEFETRLRDAFAQVIDDDLGIILVDASYYVDDFRLVLKIPRSEKVLAECKIRDAISSWIQNLLDTTAPGLVVESSKTVVTVKGRDQRFLVLQSRAAQRIQGNISGVFDMFHGSNLIGIIEGFFHTQKMYSAETNLEDVGRTGLLVGLSDMRDETAARFAAGRFRRTFRSLRPILDSVKQGVERTPLVSDVDQSDEVIEHDLVLSKSQLDERAKIFAALLIEEWTANPANVRLLRVALDMYPDHQYLEKILDLLKQGWEIGASKGVRREVRLYCLAEIFRAGATETGMVPDEECLPQGINLDCYHNRLVREATDIFNQLVTGRSSRSRLPWYLMQQVFLYLSARRSFPETLIKLGKKGGPLLALYHRFAKFIKGERPAKLDECSIFLIISHTGFSLNGIIEDIVQQGVSPRFLSHTNACSPRTASAMWEIARPASRNALTEMAERLGLQPRQIVDQVTRLPDIVSQEFNPFFFEPNLLYLANWLLGLLEDDFNKLTPWQIECELDSKNEDQFRKIDPKKFRIRRDVNMEAYLFEAPKWCMDSEDCRRYQIGALLRFAIRGTTDFFAGVSNSKRHSMSRYTRSISHWEQQRYSGFQGRSAFGPPWIPISSFMEEVLYELLRWPGSGVSPSTRSLADIHEAIKQRMGALTAQYGAHSRTLFLGQSAPPLYRQKNPTHWHRSLRIGVVQTVIPSFDDYKDYASTPDLSGDPAFRSKHRAHLVAALEGINQMQRLRDTHRIMDRDDGQKIDILIFPELAVHPDDVFPLLVPFARKHRCILLFGMVYHAIDPRKEGASLINSCQWLIPEWSRSSSNGFQLRTVEQGKFHLTDDEKKLKPAPIGFRPAQWLIDYKWSSDHTNRPLIITASVCYDATDLALLADLRSRSDLYIVCALNQDVGTFDRMSEALHYHMYQGVLLVNNGQFGGSSFFMPFEKSFHREIFHFHGQPQVAIAFAEISPEKLISRSKSTSAHEKILSSEGNSEDGLPVGSWKTPPSGWENPNSSR